MLPFLDHTKTELQGIFRELNLPPFRLNQVRNWLFARKTDDFDAMHNLPKLCRKTLRTHFGPLFAGKIVTETAQDHTEKLLIEWPDGNQIECVLLRDDRNHRTGCISTQVGCAMGCKFCASGMDGFVRNLTRGEILEQILRLNVRLENNERLTHLVIMGTGEPLLNLNSLLSALEDAIAADGLDMSARRITISTVGIPKGIEKLGECGHPYKLAVSLHAPNDELREQIVPRNRVNGIREILDSAESYHRKSGRRITFEYVLIRNLNDSPEYAKELARLLDGKTAIVNLIPFNPIPELPYQTPSNRNVEQFVAILREYGVQVKIRFRKGDKIDAACGQLRRRFNSRQPRQGCDS
ncbi:MAG: 23S rRNA (adenine(2503)-C(2))-methyltransferase RlmN [Planctomycetaceae bacterium]|nr:23S rRNA (adenine(2503)-C(2))-methyltransferase RlmN [Planctomycetaceae bacterium]